MLPEWYLNLSRSSGSAFVAAWSNADVAAVAFIAFAIFIVLASRVSADWPFDIAFLSLVAGGIMVSWPAMVVMTVAAVVLTLAVGGLHSILAPERNARIAAAAKAQVSPALEQFARDAGMSEAEVKRVLRLW
ncbi:MAG: hypothetical protein ACRET7_10405 [Burkholderiales bacterium]